MDTEAQDPVTEIRIQMEVELELARAHLLEMVLPLSDAEFRWLPQRARPSAIAWHFGHVGVEEARTLARIGLGPKRSERYDVVFGFEQMEAAAPTFPPKDEVVSFVADVRSAYLGLIDQILTRHPESLRALADTTLALINHEYSHTKYIRRLLGEMGRANAFTPSSRLVVADPRAVAAPQYSIPQWPWLRH